MTIKKSENETEISTQTDKIDETEELTSFESSTYPLTPSNSKTYTYQLPSTYTEQDNKILDAVMLIHFNLTPRLTVSVFERYKRAAQFKLTEAEWVAMYENTRLVKY